MKKCHKCHIEVMGSITRCPLCQNELEKSQTIEDEQEDLYPKKIERPKDDDILVIKIIGFIVFIISLLSIFFNIISPYQGAWSLIVTLIAGTIWLSIVIGIKNHKSILKCLWQQMIVITIVAMLIDFLIGKQGWSLTFVLPIVFTSAMIIMFILSKLLRLEVGDYMIYLLLDALFGLIPILVLLSPFQMMIRLPSYICILTSIISVFGLVLFEGKAILNELKRRLYI